MKRFICIFLIGIMMCSLVACDFSTNTNTTPQLSPEEIKKQEDERKVKNVEDLIDDIGSVGDSTFTTKDKIEKAEKAYDELDENLKSRVSNYDKIATAWKRFAYYEVYNGAKSKALYTLKSKLKDPASLQLHSTQIIVFYDANEENPAIVSVEMDYSANNSFGGAVRNDWKEVYEVRNGYLYESEKYYYKFGGIIYSEDGEYKTLDVVRTYGPPS